MIVWHYVLMLLITHIVAMVLVLLVYPIRDREGTMGLTCTTVFTVVTLVLLALDIGFAFADRDNLYWMLLCFDGLCRGYVFLTIFYSFTGIWFIRKKRFNEKILDTVGSIEIFIALVVAALYIIIQHFTGTGEVIYITILEVAYIALIIAVIICICQGCKIYPLKRKAVRIANNASKANQPVQQDSTQSETSSELLNDSKPVQQDLVQVEIDTEPMNETESLQQGFTQPGTEASSRQNIEDMRTVVVCFQKTLIQIIDKIIIYIDGESVAEVKNGQPTPLLVTSCEDHKMEVEPFRFYSKSRTVDIPHGENTIYYLVAAAADLSVNIIEIDGLDSLPGTSESN